MIGMKVRYEITDVNLKISNVTPREAESSYVLIRVADEDSEIVFALSHEQAEHLAEELYEANRRRKEHASAAAAQQAKMDMSVPAFPANNDPMHH